MPLFNLPQDSEWRDIPGYEGVYQVNVNGEIRSTGKRVKTKRGHYQSYSSKLLKPYQGQVYLSKDGDVQTVRVENIVASTFLEFDCNKPYLHHIDGDLYNCAVSNLVYVNNDDIAEIETDEWKYIPDMYPLYMASIHGEIKSCNHYTVDSGRHDNVYKYYPGRILSKQLNKDGYYAVMLSFGKDSRLVPVHRLVASTFLDNSTNLPQVNHKDGNKLNNDVTNLEWVTRSQNMQHAISYGLWNPETCGLNSKLSTGHPVRCIDENTSFLSISECANYYNMDAASVKESIRLNRPRKGHTFEYVNKE